MISIYSDCSCGFACWEAREDICRCSCSGANHGILRRGGQRPTRQCKINGELYTLAAVGSHAKLFHEAYEKNKAVGNKWMFACTAKDPYGPRVAVLRPPSASQKKWDEVSGVKLSGDSAECGVYLLWEKIATLTLTDPKPVSVEAAPGRGCEVKAEAAFHLSG